jgi:hypothetical protein
MLAVIVCTGCCAGVATVYRAQRADGRYFYYLRGSWTALRNYLGHIVTAMSYATGSTQLTLYLESPSAAAAGQHAAEEAAAAMEAAATWQVHQVGLGCLALEPTSSPARIIQTLHLWLLSGHSRDMLA